MTHTFRHPKFSNELRKRNKGAQAISNDTGIPTVKPRSPGPGLKQAIQETVPQCDIAEANAQPEVASDKLQASSTKRR